MKLLSLDLSTSNSGWAVFQDGKLTEYGNIPEPKFKGKSKLRYPQRSGIVASLMAVSIEQLILDTKPDHVVIEEVCPGGIAGVKSIKSLCQLHGIILYLLYRCNYSGFDNISMLAPSDWRKAVGLKKNLDWKLSAVKKVKELLSITLNESEHDVADAILLGIAYGRMETNK